MDTSDYSIRSNSESEEDYRSYFLQPSGSPYNVMEKIQQANLELLKCTSSNDKSVRVKFREDLVSYEPDLTDDDVVSLESDQMNELPLDNTAYSPTIQYKTEIIGTEMNIFDIEEEVDEIIEEIETDFEGEVVETAIRFRKIEQSNDKVEFDDETVNESITVSVENQTREELNSGKTTTTKRKRSKTFKQMDNKEVNCKNQCLDKLVKDFPKICLNNGKTSSVHFPPLKLRERKCCLETKTKFLPIYNGLKSEYGLSRVQLENRQKQLMLQREREQIRAELLKEYKERRMEQNEAVFSQWLKDVANRRKKNGVREKNCKLKAIKRKEHCFTPTNVISGRNKIQGEKVVEEERPKSANEIVDMSIGQNKVKLGRKRRPKSTSVYIEVPERILRVGLQVGDLLVTDDSLLVKKLHILSIS